MAKGTWTVEESGAGGWIITRRTTESHPFSDSQLDEICTGNASQVKEIVERAFSPPPIPVKELREIREAAKKAKEEVQTAKAKRRGPGN